MAYQQTISLSINAVVTINNIDGSSSGFIKLKIQKHHSKIILILTVQMHKMKDFIEGNDGMLEISLTCGGSSGLISWSAPSG